MTFTGLNLEKTATVANSETSQWLATKRKPGRGGKNIMRGDEMKVKPELLTRYSCPVCEELCESYSKAEDHCTRDGVGTWLVCSICDLDFDADTKNGKHEAADHLNEHLTNADGLLPAEQYLESLRFGTGPLYERQKVLSSPPDPEKEYLERLIFG